MYTIHAYWLIAVFAAGLTVGLLIGAVIVVVNDRRTKARQKQWNEEFHRRPIVPREDAVVVTRDPDKPRRRSRVSDAHISQPRDHWS